MNEKDFDRLIDNLAAFDDYAGKIDMDLSFDQKNPEGFNLIIDMVGCEGKALPCDMGRIISFGPMGGGPFIPCAYEENHLIVVSEGKVVIRYEDEEIILEKDDSHIIEKERKHSIWNAEENEAKAIDICLTEVK